MEMVKKKLLLPNIFLLLQVVDLQIQEFQENNIVFHQMIFFGKLKIQVKH